MDEHDVQPADSLAVLRSAVEASAESVPVAGKMSEEERRSQRVSDSGLLAIGVHDVPEATVVLRGFTAAKYPEKVQAEGGVLAGGGARASEGFEAVSALLKAAGEQKAPDEDVLREQLVFDLTLVREPLKKAGAGRAAGCGEDRSLCEGARARRSSGWRRWSRGKVRMRTARCGSGAGGFGAERSGCRRCGSRRCLRCRGCRRSRLPQELIQVASLSKDMSTRREAIFWLGQSKDPKALAYLEKVVRE